MSQLTIVMGYRDREAERIERCLKSLAEQTFQDFEVMFVDYGSQTAFAHPTEEMLRRFPFVKYIYSDTRGQPWNRSRALNIGGRMAESTYLMTTDVDMIFPPDFLSVVMENAGAKKVLYCVPHFMTEGFKDWEHIEENIAKFHVGGEAHRGGCQVIPTRVFQEIRGFDETYEYWGTEDRDMNKRLTALGFKEYWLNDQIHFFHQWHPKGNYASESFIPDGLWGRAQVYFYRQLNETKRNSKDWGHLQTSPERKVFKFLDLENKRIIEGPGLTHFEEPPDNNSSSGFFVVRFWEMPAGQAMAVDNAFFPKTFGWGGPVFSFANGIFKRFGNRTRIGWRANLLHAFLAEFIEQNSDLIADYYIGFPAANGVSILVKA